MAETLQVIEALSCTCLGLRWIFSASYRRELRESEKRDERAIALWGVFWLVFFGGVLLAVSGFGIASLLRTP